MRFSIIKIVFLKELREMLRDRRSLAIMFGIPLLLYPLMTLAIAGLGMQKEKELQGRIAQVAIDHPDAVPHLLDLMAEPQRGIALISPADPQADLAAGKIDAILLAPPHAERDLLASKDVAITTRLDRSRTSSLAAERKIDRLLDNYQKWLIEQRLRDVGVPVGVLEPIQRHTDDIATGEQRFGKMLAMALPVLLLLTGMLGAMFPALNATTTERELGTLETLLVTPAGRSELLVAKAALVLLCGLLTAGLNMLSMSLVLWRSVSMMQQAIGPLKISVSSMLLTYLAAVPTLITFSTIVLIVGLLARNFREANSLATPVMMIPLASMLVGIAEPAVSAGLLVTPVANTTIIIREVLTGRVSPLAFVLAFASSCLYAGLLLSVAARVFTSEQLVNPAWEPVSLKGLKFGAARLRKRRLPAIDEAFALFAVSMLLSFYITPSLIGWPLIPMLAAVELLLIAAPALLFATFGHYDWTETFKWRRPSIAALLGGLLIGLGMVPWSDFFYAMQVHLWTPDPNTARAMGQIFLPALAAHPWLTPLAVGAFAGVCEEILFRGPIQTGLLRRMPVRFALVVGGLLFAVAHLDAFGTPLRTVIGVVLGWIVFRTNSIFPAMLAHGIYDATKMAIGAYAVKTQGVDKVLGESTAPHAGANDFNLWLMLLGAALLVIGWYLIRRRDIQSKT